MQVQLMKYMVLPLPAIIATWNMYLLLHVHVYEYIIILYL